MKLTLVVVAVFCATLAPVRLYSVDTDVDIITSDTDSDADTVEDIPGEPLNPMDFDNARDIEMDDFPSNDTDPLMLAGAFEGDIAGVNVEELNAIDGPKPFFKNAILMRSDRWPNGVIPYSISKSFNNQERGTIAKAFDEYQKHTCLKFKPRTHEQDYISIHRGSGCSSSVGRSRGGQTLSLGNGCVYVGVIIHELMHAAGFWHEQSRADRDQYITINYNNIIPGLEYNFKKYSWNEIQNLGVSYDTESIMHYGPYAFAKNRKIPTIVPKQGGNIGQRKGFSKRDIEKLRKLYECDTPTVAPGKVPVLPPATCKNGDMNCEAWARMGECKKNPYYMKYVCRESCRTCGKDCRDFNTLCPKWAASGECQNNAPYMHVFCQKSCKMCEGCKDGNKYCEDWARDGQCSVNPGWMLVHCQKSCRVC